MNELIQWIESHGVTVGLLQWGLLLLVAWFAGAFRLLASMTKKPKLRVSEVVSLCTILSEPHEEKSDAQKAAFLLNVEVVNPSRTLVVINSLEMRYLSKRPICSKSEWTSSVSLPNRVRVVMGSGTKFMRNWFAHFDDGQASLTVDGPIEPNHAASGYALFVTHTWGSWNPRLGDGKVRVTCRAKTATGGTLKTRADITVVSDPADLEEMVPGILDQVRHRSAWNVPSRF